MNRRTFTATVAAIGALGSIDVAAQSTPEVDKDASPKSILASYLNRVIGGGELDAIPEYFSDELDLEQIYWDHADLQADSRSKGDDIRVTTHVILGDNLDAMAYVTLESESMPEKEMFIVISTDNTGKIVAYRWSVE